MTRPARRLARHAALAMLGSLALATSAFAAPPIIQCPGPVTTLEGGGFQVTITASDPDNDPVTLSCVNTPRFAIFDPPTGIFSWVPTFQQAGDYALQFQAAANGETTSCVVPVTVLNLDRAPTPSCPGPATVSLTDTLRMQFTAFDPDKDPLTWSSPNLPRGATLSSSGALVFATERSGAGTFTFEVDVSDGTVSVGCSATVTVHTATLNPKIYCPGTTVAAPGTPTTFTVTGASSTGKGVSFSATGLPPGATFDGAIGLFQWTPTANQQGSYVVTFTAQDKGSGLTSSCATQLNVGSSFVQPPTFTQCPTPVNGVELGQILVQCHATDPQGFLVTYVASNLPTGATFLGQFGALNWTPAVGQAGTYDVTVTASNGSKTAQCVLHIVVAAVQQPQFTQCPGTLSGTELQPVQFLVQATDPNNFALTYSAVGLPAGAAFDPSTRVFSWTPAIAQAGSWTVTFKATSLAGVAQCPVHLNIAPVTPGTPVISCPASAPFTIQERQTLSFQVTATDPQNRTLALLLANPPAGATFASGLFTWAPTITQAGSYSLHFTASNSFNTASCDVGVTVTNRPNTPPHLSCPASFTSTVNRLIAFSVPAVDAEGDPVTYSSRDLPSGAAYGNGVFAWSPADAAVGTYAMTFIATDSELRDSCTVTLDVRPHTGAVGELEPVLGRVRDIRPDQGGWLRVTLVAAPDDAGGSVTGYELWRRIEGPDSHALTPGPQARSVGAACAARTALTAPKPGAIVPAAQAAALGFPPGTWESVSYTPSLQAANLFIDVPTRDDSSAAGRPYEVFVASAHTLSPANWGVSPADSGYSVDDLAPRAPAALAAQSADGGVRLTWSGSPDVDLDHYVVERAASAEFAADGLVELGATRDSSFLDAAPRADQWYRVLAVDVHGNASSSAPLAGPRAAVWGVRGVLLSAPRPNPTRGETAFDLVLPAAGEASVEIVDARGARVRTLLAGAAPGGPRTLVWDGRDQAGRAMPSGLYHLRVRANGVALARKIVLLR